MTKQPENKDKAEPRISKDELSEQDLEQASGGGGAYVSEISITKVIDKSSPVLVPVPLVIPTKLY